MKKKGRLLEIDSLRGIAALSVLFFHFNLWHTSFLKYGCLGVDLFFMISGFVIFMSISKTANLKDFWFARFNRLFPAYWLSLIIAVVSFRIFSTFSFHQPLNFILGNFLMMQPLFKTTNLVDAYWTLYIELGFYAFISIVWLLKLIDRIEELIWVALIAMIVLNSVYLLFPDNASYTRLFIIFRSIMPLICFFNYFAAGMVFYNVSVGGLNPNRIALLTVCFLIVALTHTISGRALHFVGLPGHILVETLFYVLFILIIKGRAKLLSNKVLLFFGAISYPLYLIHESIGWSFLLFFVKYTTTAVAVFSALLISLLLSAIISYLFETPVHRWLRSKYFKKQL